MMIGKFENMNFGRFLACEEEKYGREMKCFQECSIKMVRQRSTLKNLQLCGILLLNGKKSFVVSMKIKVVQLIRTNFVKR